MGLGVCIVLLACWTLTVSGTALPPGVIAGTGNTVGFGEQQEEWRGEVILLSWKPRAFVLKNFLTDEECAHLIKTASPSMTKSTVVDNVTGKTKDSDVRTSTGTFLDMDHDEIVSQIERRVSHVTMLPKENQEGLQILHYQNGQKYEPHYDYFHDTVNADAAHGGQRVVTVLMYLSTPEEGGETVFPEAEHKVQGDHWSDCAKAGMALKVYKGDALMFYSLKPDGSTDKSSLHGSCPTLKGEKWSATKWIHVGRFGLNAAQQKVGWGDCIDTNESCQEWAFFGECEKNPKYMMFNCRKACKQCTPAANASDAKT